MMKQTQTIIAKYCGRAFSTIASSPLSSSVKRGWEEQDGLDLCLAFTGGYVGHVLKNIYKRREHWYKVDRMNTENIDRKVELYERSSRYRRALLLILLEDRKSSS